MEELHMSLYSIWQHHRYVAPPLMFGIHVYSDDTLIDLMVVFLFTKKENDMLRFLRENLKKRLNCSTNCFSLVGGILEDSNNLQYEWPPLF